MFHVTIIVAAVLTVLALSAGCAAIWINSGIGAIGRVGLTALSLFVAFAARIHRPVQAVNGIIRGRRHVLLFSSH